MAAGEGLMYEIPYRAETRPDTGLYNGKLGMWLVLAAEIMFFGALYSSYVFLRVAADFWPAGGSVLPLGVAALAVLAAALAAGCIARAWTTAKTDATRFPQPLLAGALVAAILFFVLLLWQGMLVRNTGAHPAASNFYGLYFLFLTLHGAFALMGAAAMAWAGFFHGATRDSTSEAYANRLECVGMFWQLNAIFWVITFALFHLF